MALQKVLNMKPERPYYCPPTINIKVVDMVEETMVILWVFEEGDAHPSTTKMNNIAVISVICAGQNNAI